MATRTVTRASSAAIAPHQPIDILRYALGNSTITVDVPENATLNQIEDTLKAAIDGTKQLLAAADKIRPIIGRLMLTVRQRKLYKGTHKSFTSWYTEKVIGELGLPKSSALDALRIASRFPSMSQDEYYKYGASRLLAAAQFTSEEDPQYKEILESSLQMPVEEFKEYAKEHVPIPEGAEPSHKVTLAIRVDDTIQVEFNTLVSEDGRTAGEVFTDMLHSYRQSLRKRPATSTRGAPARARGAA